MHSHAVLSALKHASSFPLTSLNQDWPLVQSQPILTLSIISISLPLELTLLSHSSLLSLTLLFSLGYLFSPLLSLTLLFLTTFIMHSLLDSLHLLPFSCACCIMPPIPSIHAAGSIPSCFLSLPVSFALELTESHLHLCPLQCLGSILFHHSWDCFHIRSESSLSVSSSSHTVSVAFLPLAHLFNSLTV
jgi:hypothetical protein